MALNDPATLVGDVGTCLGSSRRMVSSVLLSSFVVDFVNPIKKNIYFHVLWLVRLIHFVLWMIYLHMKKILSLQLCQITLSSWFAKVVSSSLILRAFIIPYNVVK